VRDIHCSGTEVSFSPEAGFPVDLTEVSLEERGRQVLFSEKQHGKNKAYQNSMEVLLHFKKNNLT
jgi:hypothetical protein